MRNLCTLLCLLLLAPAAALANGYETYPAPLAWSKDSTLLASVEAQSWPYHDGLVSGSLRLYHFDGTPLHELLAGSSIGSPAFSPDGLLACVYDGKIAVFEGYLEPSSVRFLSGPAPALDVTFELDADGTARGLLATFGERFYGADIWRVSFDGGKLEQLTFTGEDGSALSPLSWPGLGLLYLYQPGYAGPHTYERIWALDTASMSTMPLIDSTQIEPEYPDDYHESNLQPLVTSGEMFYQRGGWGDWKVYRLSNFNEETLELADAQQPSVSADGRWLAFVRRPAYAKAQLEYDWEVVPQIWLADRECRELWRVETSLAGGEFPTLSPDGSRLAWLQFDNGAVQTVVREVAEITAGEPDGTY